MKSLRDPSSRIYKICGTIIDLFFLNLLFILGSLPIVTIAVSGLAMYTVIMRIESGESCRPVEEYWEAFKRNFRTGIILGLLLFVLIGLVIFSLLFGFLLPVWQSVVVLIGATMLTVILFFSIIYVFPYLARYEDNILTAFGNSFKISCQHRATTIIILTLLIMIFIFGSLSDVSLALTSWVTALLGFSGGAMGISKLVLPIFHEYECG